MLYVATLYYTNREKCDMARLPNMEINVQVSIILFLSPPPFLALTLLTSTEVNV